MSILKRNDVLVIGTGNGGGKVADSIAGFGKYSVMAMNSAKGDLNGLDNIPEEDRFHFDKGTGSGGDREKGKEYARRNMPEIFNMTDETYSHANKIFIFASTAGGTGSGSALEVAYELALRYSPDRTEEERAMYFPELPDKSVHVYAITPSPEDRVGLTGYKNNLAFLQELKELADQGIIDGYTILNNNALDKMEINEQFAIDFDAMLSVPEDTKVMGHAIDGSDMDRAIMSKGFFHMSKINLTPKNEEAVNIVPPEYLVEFPYKGCKHLIATFEDEMNLDYFENVSGHYGYPEGGIQKAGVTNGGDNRAFAFGMDYPIAIIKEAKLLYQSEVDRLKQQQADREKQAKKYIDVDFEPLEEFETSRTYTKPEARPRSRIEQYAQKASNGKANKLESPQEKKARLAKEKRERLEKAKALQGR